MNCPFLRGELSMTEKMEPLRALNLHKIVAALVTFVVTFVGAMIPFVIGRWSKKQRGDWEHDQLRRLQQHEHNAAPAALASSSSSAPLTGSSETPLLNIINALASGSLLGLVLLHMLPEVFADGSSSSLGFFVGGKHIDASPMLSFLGFSLMLLCEKCLFAPWGICPHSHSQHKQHHVDIESVRCSLPEHHSGCHQQHCCFEGHQERHLDGGGARGGRSVDPRGLASSGNSGGYNDAASNEKKLPPPAAPRIPRSGNVPKGPVAEKWPEKSSYNGEDDARTAPWGGKVPLDVPVPRGNPKVDAVAGQERSEHEDNIDSERDVLVPLLSATAVSAGGTVGDLKEKNGPLAPSAAGSISILATTLGLAAHSVVEGLLVGLATNPSAIWTLVAFICSHEWMTALAVSNICIRKRASRPVVVLALLVFTSASSIGVLVGMAHISHLPLIGSKALVAVATGLILYAAAEITFETFDIAHSARRVRQQIALLAAFIAGAAVIVLVSVGDALISPCLHS